MKKAVTFLLLTCAVPGLYASYLILSSPLSEISKVIALIGLGFVYLNVGLPVIRDALDTWSTTKKQVGSNQQRTQKENPESGLGTKNPKVSRTTDDIAHSKNSINEDF